MHSRIRQWGAALRYTLGAIALSAAGIVGIVQYEGYSDRAIIPIPGDVPTLGFGTTEGVKLGDRTTPQQALARALADISKYEGAIKQCVKVPLTRNEYDAYVSLAYNIGPGAFCGSTLVRLLNQEKYAEACAQISRWDQAGGRAVPGLTARRAKERALCEKE